MAPVMIRKTDQPNEFIQFSSGRKHAENTKVSRWRVVWWTLWIWAARSWNWQRMDGPVTL